MGLAAFGGRCYKCGKEGHKAKECTGASAKQDSKPKGSGNSRASVITVAREVTRRVSVTRKKRTSI